MNLKELSRHLGLSQTTVSRALNGYPEVSENSRQRILEAALRFGYRPNPTARTLATGRAGAIGVLFPFGHELLLDPHFAEFLAGVAETGARLDFNVLLKATRDDDHFSGLSRGRTVDALILSGPSLQDQRLPRLAAQAIPTVIHGRTIAEAPYAFLDIDNECAFFAATAHLIGLGHRRIGLINGDIRQTFAHDRERGWRAALAARGLAAPEMLARSGAMTEENGYRLAADLLDLSPRPTALLCSSMLSVLGSVRAIRDRDLKIGEDIALIAHDDGLTAIRPESMTPALTTTYSSIRAAGARVAEIALAIADGAPPCAHQEIWPVELIARASSPPPKVDV